MIDAVNREQISRRVRAVSPVEIETTSVPSGGGGVIVGRSGWVVRRRPPAL